MTNQALQDLQTAYTEGPDDCQAHHTVLPVAIILGSGTSFLMSNNPDLLKHHIPAVLDSITGRLRIIEGCPHANWKDHEVALNATVEPGQLFKAISDNFGQYEEKNHTRMLFCGLVEGLDLHAVLYRKPDLLWANVRLDWPTTELAKRTVKLMQKHSGAAKVIDYSYGIPSGEFRTLALAHRRKAMKECFNCGAAKKELKTCTGCRNAWYCTTDCQQQNWRVHKSCCSHFKGKVVLSVADAELLADVESQ